MGCLQTAAGSRHGHIWLRSGAKCEVCRGPGYFALLCADLLDPPWTVGVHISRALRARGIALAPLHLHPWAGVPASPLSRAAFEPAGRVATAAAMSAGAVSRLEMSFVKA